MTTSTPIPNPEIVVNPVLTLNNVCIKLSSTFISVVAILRKVFFICVVLLLKPASFAQVFSVALQYEIVG